MGTRVVFEGGWYYTAVNALATLATSEGTCSSATIAQGVDAHAAHLRRVLALLGRAGIVEAREGRAGGYRLARDPQDITLAEVFKAVQAAEPLEDAAASNCRRSCVFEVLDEIGLEAEREVLLVLERHSLASLLARVARRRDGRHLP
jgi:Rrf2 family protein